VLARYSDSHGRLREVLTRPGSAGSVLLVDRDARTRRDHRLIAHLAADEPPANAALTCKDYLRHSRERPPRPLTAEDLFLAPFADAHADDAIPEAELLDCHGRSYQLLAHAEGIAIPELRWHRLAPAPPSGAGLLDDPASHGDPRPISLREVIACLQSYRPVRDITARALARAHPADPQRDSHAPYSHAPHSRLSVSTLRGELQRVDASPIVLNRRLREAVQRAIAGGDSLSGIATRCGRFKRESSGTVYGDTSWLARRVGLLPNAGKTEPTPWIHSDVLALVARRGLRISPREVEL
jgi:hypothetical protein